VVLQKTGGLLVRLVGARAGDLKRGVGLGAEVHRRVLHRQSQQTGFDAGIAFYADQTERQAGRRTDLNQHR
jgi:hypothetical protein